MLLVMVVLSRSTKGTLSTIYSINNEYKLSLHVTGIGNYYKSNKTRQGEFFGRGEN